MPIIDPGVTKFDDLGRPTLSNQAVNIPAPKQFKLPPSGLDATASNITDVPPSIQPPDLSAASMPLNIPSAVPPVPSNLMPNRDYRDYPKAFEAEQIRKQMPMRNDPSLQPHGLAKLGDIIASATMGPFAPIEYQLLKQKPYDRAMQDWQAKLAAIRPELTSEESQAREKGEDLRNVARLGQQREYHQEELDEKKQAHAESTRKDLADEELKRQKEQGVEKQRKAKLDLQNQQLDELMKYHKSLAEKGRGDLLKQIQGKIAEFPINGDPEDFKYLTGVRDKLVNQEAQLSGAKAEASAKAQAMYAEPKAKGAAKGKTDVEYDPNIVNKEATRASTIERAKMDARFNAPNATDKLRQEATTTSISHINNLRNLASDPWISTHMGPILGRINEFGQIVGANPVAKTPEESRKESDFLHSITLATVWEASALSRGQGVYRLVQTLKNTIASGHMDSPTFLGALDAAERSAANSYKSFKGTDPEILKKATGSGAKTSGRPRYTIGAPLEDKK